MTGAIWTMPARTRGRRPAGAGPTHAEWLTVLPQGWWTQTDAEDGPIFCRWVKQAPTPRHSGDWWQVMLGPGDWSGVWQVRGTRQARRPQFRLSSVATAHGPIPMAHFGRGNLAPVQDWQADVTPDLRAILLREHLVTASEWARFTGPRFLREPAARTCRRMVWF